MGLRRDFVVLGVYFLILSTVLQAEDAFVSYYDFEYEPQRDSIRNSRLKMMVAFGIVALLNLLTLVVAPYLNCSIQRLATAACAILLVKYGCELASFTKVLAVMFELGAFFADIIGTGLFYLSSLRLVQLTCEKHEMTNRAGLCFGVFVGLYGLSILLGYLIGYGFYDRTPAWLFLIALTCLTMVAAVIAFFSFGHHSDSDSERQRQRNNPPPNNAAAAAAADQAHPEEGYQLLRDGLHLGRIIKFTMTTYRKLIPLTGVQMMLGTLFAYGYELLKFLVWTSQSQSDSQKLAHNKDVMVIYSIGAIFSACLIGFICDRLPVRKLGYGLLVYNGLSILFLFFALYIKYFYTTFLLFMFLGMTEFAVLVWLLAALSRLYKGIFEVIAANAQSVAMAASGYGLCVIFFQGRMDPQTKLASELGLLTGMNILAFLFARKLPDDPVTIEYLVEELDESGVRANQEREGVEVERRENPVPVEIQMTQRAQEFEEGFTKEGKIDQENLL